MNKQLVAMIMLVTLLAGCSTPTAVPTSPTSTPAPTHTPAQTDAPTATPIPNPTATQAPVPVDPPADAAPGDIWPRPNDGMVMVHVPGGTFQMGSEEGTLDASYNEFPQHPVTLDSFWIDRTEVSNAQYARCVAAGACDPPLQNNSHSRTSYYGNSTYDDYPVIHVDWYDAETYCGWAGARLPTEAEWEYAARGPEGYLYPWGNSPPDETLLNFEFNVEDTTRVGSYPDGLSWCGALDLAGNVWEFVADRYGEYPAEAQVNPTGPSTGELRLLRGGSYWSHPNLTRSTSRSGDIPPNYSHVDHGFRCATR